MINRAVTITYLLGLCVVISLGCKPHTDRDIIRQVNGGTTNMADKLGALKMAYSHKIQSGISGDDAVHYAVAMDQLMSEWNPIGHTREQVVFLLGEPSHDDGEFLTYRFDTGYGGTEWVFKLRDSQVVGVEKRGLD